MEVKEKDCSSSLLYYFLSAFFSLSMSTSPFVCLSVQKCNFLPSHCLQLFMGPLLPILADCSYLFTTNAVMRYGCECSGHINATLISC